MNRHTRNLLMIAGGTLMLAGCFDGSSSDGTGTLSLDITDAPVDNATAVVVEFSGVEIQPADGQRISFEFDEIRSIDLLTLQGNDSEPLLEGESVPAGEYEWIRLQVNAVAGTVDSFIEFEDGGQHSLFVPSGSETGLKLVSGFTVPAGGAADFTIDFDLRKSVTNPQGKPDYILKPALRMVNNVDVGSISGTVADAWAADDACSPAVYVYTGHDAEAGSEGSDNPPLTSALVALNDDSGEFEYTVGFLEEADYSAAFTCEADQDDPEEGNDIEFLQKHNSSVTAGEESTVDFGPDV
ncbi:DUF4382 domain-containing protein [Gammaproteobacteria bacterium AB-CW1]|uniref:DUF4382 domain-containing protein n=1 Tax=Natronospira elongata TaxID=3110268 RepID=A0AAP6MLC5_9GAMM|nr:DUF4382 domain-containing protein [Gammaproteobacteria bacterium AB-CW1]